MLMTSLLIPPLVSHLALLRHIACPSLPLLQTSSPWWLLFWFSISLPWFSTLSISVWYTLLGYFTYLTWSGYKGFQPTHPPFFYSLPSSSFPSLRISPPGNGAICSTDFDCKRKGSFFSFLTKARHTHHPHLPSFFLPGSPGRQKTFALLRKYAQLPSFLSISIYMCYTLICCINCQVKLRV
jgi:hypothetical protein